MSITPTDITNLRQSMCPYPHARADWRPGLSITKYSKDSVHSLAFVDGESAGENSAPYYVVRNSTGYLCATRSTSILLDLIAIESSSPLPNTLRNMLLSQSQDFTLEPVPLLEQLSLAPGSLASLKLVF